MTAALENLFPAHDRERLIRAIQLRTSCRSYAGAPDAADHAALSYAAARSAMPGARIAFFPVEDGFFTGSLLGMKRITGCRLAAAVIINGESHARLHAGVLGESLVLEATALGLGSCWVSGSYRQSAVPAALNPGETVLCVIALGKPERPLSAPTSRHRKPPEHFCRGNFRTWPEQLLNAAALVQQSPSAMNMQPWVLWIGQQGEFVLDAADRAELDAGIALVHAELALNTPHTWHFGTQKSEPIAWAVVR